MKSKYVEYENISKHNSGKRTHKVDRITPHCIVGQWSAKKCCDYFATTVRECSSNYAIGKDGEIGLSVPEEFRSWCSSNRENDQRAITIECASEKDAPYEMNDAVVDSLIKLCIDICERYGKDTLLWISDEEQALSYEPKENEMLLTVHRWFANKSCPGDYLYNRLGEIAEKVTGELKKEETFYCVQVGAYIYYENAEKMLNKLKNQGYDAFITKKQIAK